MMKDRPNDAATLVPMDENAGTKQRHGHPRFYEILEELSTLHSMKNHDYATGGDPLGNFKRRAQLYSMYPGLDLSDPTVVAVVDAMKQLDAILWFLSNKHTPMVEGKADRPVYKALKRMDEEHLMEEVGKELRQMMPWLQK